MAGAEKFEAQKHRLEGRGSSGGCFAQRPRDIEILSHIRNQSRRSHEKPITREEPVSSIRNDCWKASA